MTQIKHTMKERQGLSGIFQLLLANLYKKVGQEIKIQPGAEFRAALEEVQRGYTPCRLVLGDRAIGVTIQRAWALLPIKEKLMLCFQLIKALFMKIGKEDIERMKQSDVLADLMIEFSVYFPSLTNVLLKERDIYLARSLYECTGQRVLAVVGLGHVRGMQETIRRWQEQPELREAECRHLTHVPPTSWTGRRMVLALLILVVLLGVGAFYGLRAALRTWWWG
jgi:pheromone shutdown protein TraB